MLTVSSAAIRSTRTQQSDNNTSTFMNVKDEGCRDVVLSILEGIPQFLHTGLPLQLLGWQVATARG